MNEPMLRVWMEEPIKPAAHVPERPGRWIAEPVWPSPNIRRHRLALNTGRLAETAEPETVLSIRSPQSTGLMAGHWCPYGLGPDQPKGDHDHPQQKLCALALRSGRFCLRDDSHDRQNTAPRWRTAQGEPEAHPARWVNSRPHRASVAHG